MINRQRTLERKTAIIGLVITVQALVALFFLGDIIIDLATEKVDLHLVLEGLSCLTLLMGVVVSFLQFRWLFARARIDVAAVAMAQGAMADLVRLRFAQWNLTAAESDVALFALKGCEIPEIAQYRQAAMGTVRAQLTRIYHKADVHSQAQLMALFMDEMVGTIADRGTAAAPQ